MPPFLYVLATRWRLVNEAGRLGRAREAAQECKGTARVVGKWCRRANAICITDDTPRAGMPQAPLALGEDNLILKEGVKRRGQCPLFANML